MKNNNLILSIDGGGSKTDFLIVDIKKLIKYELSGPGSNPNFYGIDGIKNLINSLKILINKNNIDKNEVDLIILGLAGISNKKYKNYLDNFFDSFFPNKRIILTSDAEIAHKSIWGDEKGITLLVGTGTIGISNENNQHSFITSGGLGFENHDVGGGYWIGKTLIFYLISTKNLDKNIVYNDLIEMVKEHYKKNNFNDVLDFSLGIQGRLGLASLAPKVIDLAKQGNEIAYKICDDGCEGLKQILLDLDFKENNKIAFHGSLILKSEFYRNILISKFNNLNWIKSSYKSVYGGLTILNGLNPKNYKNFKENGKTNN